MSGSATHCKYQPHGGSIRQLNALENHMGTRASLTVSVCATHPCGMSYDITLSERVAEEIRAVLGRRRMSGRQLATKLGVSQSWMSTRLAGSTPIDLNDLERIAGILDVDVLELLPVREGRLITVGGTRPRPGRELTTVSSPLTKRPGPFGPRGRTPAPSTSRTGRIPAALAAV